ncbi:hypothetical protein [Neorhizobium sp. S3-V5DH]|uniref:hypothetical protein n=1 Tax=Neorhizobium sp. S3-V5DH TaxID=2485166 RepID=UPI001048281E|nr:hypothetical protein [Neorhizobium sp. S3-V5DH]TCV66298.1 hypothetical protein EDE09_11649 [Neorhizobium sp. S3-V5DH]
MSYRRADFDTVAPLMPFDKTASMVTGKGEHFEWSPSNLQKVHSTDPIRTRAPNRDELQKPSFTDLTGKKIGRFTVLGIAADVVTTNGQNWVVRCVCGAYETRKSRFIKKCVAGDNPGEQEPMCDACGYTRRLQMGRWHPKKAAAAAEAIQNHMR